MTASGDGYVHTSWDGRIDFAQATQGVVSKMRQVSRTLPEYKTGDAHPGGQVPRARLQAG